MGRLLMGDLPGDDGEGGAMKEWVPGQATLAVDVVLSSGITVTSRATFARPIG